MVCEVESEGADVQRHSRAGYVGAGLRAAAMAWKALASEHAEAKATRIRDAVSITRAATLRSRRRRVANSAVASGVALGMACRRRHISQ